MIAVYTYWDTENLKTYSGYNTSKELAMALSLSIEYTRKQFKKVKLVTNLFGKSLLIDYYKLDFDEVDTFLEGIDTIPESLWAYWKIYSYSQQTEPFIHLDNDVILLEAIPDSVLNCDMAFQNKEMFATHLGYQDMLKIAKSTKPNIPDIIYNGKNNWAYNCGVVICNKLDAVYEWRSTVDDFILSEESKLFFVKTKDKNYTNHFMEQLFASRICEANNLKVGEIIENFSYKTCSKETKLAHFWGGSKRMQVVSDKIKALLTRSKNTVLDIPVPDADVFSNIYNRNLWGNGSGAGSSPEESEPFRKLLENFIEQKNIYTIVDIGCGDWQMMELVNFNFANYLGVDCVKSVIEKDKERYSNPCIEFLCADIKTYEVPECDLLIIKDVFIHWRNEDILKFLPQLSKCKYALIVNDTANISVDLKETGMFRAVNVWEEPFNVSGKILLQYNNKTVFLYSLT